MAKAILITNIVTTIFMVGVIRLVQFLNYPLFAKAGSNFSAYHQYHMKWITVVIAVPMIAEFVTTVAMLFYPYPSIPTKLIWLGIVLIFVIWLSTIFFSVPVHDQLTLNYSEAHVKRLVDTNWIRTIAWTARAILCIYFLKLLIK